MPTLIVQKKLRDEDEKPRDEAVTTPNRLHDDDNKVAHEGQREVTREAAEKLRASVSLPPPPAKRPTWDQAEAYFNLLTPEMFPNLETYLYRIEPKIIRQLSDANNPKYIDIIEGRPLREYIKQTHGGGVYSLRVNDRGTKRGGSNKELMDITLRIPVTEADPKLILAELDCNARENRGYVGRLIAEGKLTQDGKVVGPNGQGGTHDATVQLAESVINSQQAQINRLMNQENTIGGAVGQILLEQMKQNMEQVKQNNPTSQVNGVAAIIGAVKEMIPPPPKTETGLLETVLKLQADNHKAMMDLMEKFINAQNKPREREREDEEEERQGGMKGFLTNVKELGEVVSLFKGGRAAEKSTLEVVMDGVSAVGPQLLQAFQSVMTYATVSKSGGWMPPAAPAQGGGFGNPPGWPAANPPAGFTSPQTAAAPPAIGAPEASYQPQAGPAASPAPASGPLGPLQMFITQFGPILANHLVGGTRGQDFGETFYNMYGPEVFNSFAQISTDEIVEAAKGVPDFWARVKISGNAGVFGEAYLRQWIEAMKNWEKLLSEEGDDSE